MLFPIITFGKHDNQHWILSTFYCCIHSVGLTGLFCPCVLFGRNVESLNEEISQTGACVGHVICVEGGITLAVVTAAMHGIDPDTMCLITEGLLFTWWVCGIYTGMARQALQRKYHLKVVIPFPLIHIHFLATISEVVYIPLTISLLVFEYNTCCSKRQICRDDQTSLQWLYSHTVFN